MNRIKLWPHATLIVLGAAIIATGAALLWIKYERTAQAKEMPGAARIERVSGQVGLNQSLDESAKTQWTEATANTPISVGDRVITRDNSQTEIALTGRNFATVDPNSALDVLELSDQKTQLALRDGAALLDVGALASGALFEVGTPCGAVDFEKPGLYRIDATDSGKAMVTAFSGQASVIGQGGTGTIDKGETLTIPCQGAPGAVRSQVDYGQAGNLLDSYYRSRYPRRYDGRYRNYYTYLDDPYYFDPYRSEISYQYVNDYIPGVEDLDDYGNWTYLNGYGYSWHPNVETGWAPYQSGSWQMDYPYGLTWVSNEPWGYAPYHYGRWTYASNEWFWVPENGTSYPAYSPALVAFMPFGGSSVGWVALGPGDPYVPRYYDTSWQPVYLSRQRDFDQRIANLAVPGAVVVVPAQQFTRVIDPRFINRVDAQTVARVRPVMDPLAVDQLRQAAFRTREGRARFDLPQAMAQRLNNTPVLTTNGPQAQAFRRDLARNMRIESVSDRARGQKLQIADQRATAGNSAVSQPANQATEQARERQMLELSRQAGRGDRAARQQLVELRRQQTEQQRLDRAANGQQGGQQAAQQAQGERVAQEQNQRALLRQQQQVQREAARQQILSSQQQRRAAGAQELQVQREQRQQTEILRAQQRSVRHAEQPRQLPQQLKVQPAPQIRERKPPTQYQVPVTPVMRSQPNRQNERQAAPQATRQPRQVQPQPRPQPQPQAAPKHAEQSAPAAPKGQKKKPPQ